MKKLNEKNCDMVVYNKISNDNKEINNAPFWVIVPIISPLFLVLGFFLSIFTSNILFIDIPKILAFISAIIIKVKSVKSKPIFFDTRM